MSTFGKTDDGASSSNSATERKCVSSATATTSGIVSSLTARIWLASAGSGHFKGVIYADSAGAPGSLLATTDEVSFTNTSEAEVTASFSGSNIIGIDVGKTYWIGYITGDTSGIAVHQSRADNLASQKRSNDTYSDGPTDPFGATSDANGKIDCYVTYTDSAIQYDTTSTGMDAADPSSLTWSHTTTTGSNRILVVGTSTESDTGGHTAQTVSGITYGSTVTFTNLTSGSDETSGTSATTASVTPTANKLQLLTVTCRKDSAEPATPTISGNGLTWELVNSEYYDTTSTSRKKIFVFRSMGSSPTSGAITITFGETWTHCYWSLDEATNADTSGTNGSGAIVQSAVNLEDAGNGGTLSVTLSAFAAANNATFGAFAADPGTGTWTVGSGFTKLGASDSATINLGTEYKSTNDTGVDMTCDAVAGTSSGGIAIEIKALNAQQTLTKIRTDYITDNGTELWYLVAPATGANNIIVTMTGAVDGLFGAGLTFTGVNQTNPIDTSAGTTTTGTSISQALTTTDVNDMLVNITQHYNSSTVLTPDAFQTERFNTPTTGDNDQAGGTRLVGAIGSYTTSWTNDISDGVTLSVVALRDINASTTSVKDLIMSGMIPFPR